MGKKVTKDKSFISDDLEEFIRSLGSDDIKKEEKPKPLLESGRRVRHEDNTKTSHGAESSGSIKSDKGIQPKAVIGADGPDFLRETHSDSFWKEFSEDVLGVKAKEQTDHIEEDSAPRTKDVHYDVSNGYVSRAGFKLAGAVEAFSFDFVDKTVLDIGSSTGGFTEYALVHGARRVIAVEKGTSQMDPQLRLDSRIDLNEKTDIFTITHQSLGDVDVILADVSFISLTQVLAYAKKELASRAHCTDFLVMLKPQFEARPDQLFKGVVKNERIRRDIIKNFEFWCRRRGFVVKAKRDNDIAGKSGNVERFYWLVLSR